MVATGSGPRGSSLQAFKLNLGTVHMNTFIVTMDFFGQSYCCLITACALKLIQLDEGE